MFTTMGIWVSQNYFPFLNFHYTFGCNVHRPNQIWTGLLLNSVKNFLQALISVFCWHEYISVLKKETTFSSLTFNFAYRSGLCSLHNSRNISICWSEFQPTSLLYSKMFLTVIAKFTVEVYGFFSKSLFRSLCWEVLWHIWEPTDWNEVTNRGFCTQVYVPSGDLSY